MVNVVEDVVSVVCSMVNFVLINPYHVPIDTNDDASVA